MIYFAIFVLLVILSYSDPRRLYFIVSFALFLFIAFRFETGCDWWGYFNQYQSQGSLSFYAAIEDPEPIWNLILHFQMALDIPYPWLNVLSAGVFFSGIHQIAKRQSSPFTYLVLLFPILMVNMPMSAVKQATAIGLICFAFIAFSERKVFRFVAITATAALIHNSAAIFLLLSPLVVGEITQRRLLFAALLALPGMAALLATEGAEVATTRYVDSGVDAAGAIYRVLLLGITGFAYFYLRKRGWLAEERHFSRLTFIGSIMMIVLLAILPLSSVIADRFGYYLIPIQAIIFANLRFSHFPHFRWVIVSSPFVVLLITFGVWTNYSGHFNLCYVPYKSWILGFPDGYYSIYR
ncbi:EpsG family protein [Qipengyuania sp. GH1]|uniref:EpsG family protein n=1 Tax=Qipengyuania aestuarii TaxID=2867241 RepID=UPI001C87B762|nr:EpsG family protein [Qipengyuania aestuarii]MBX7535483.1 EpsG family protein [Qipengyuania aestuarii]